VYVWTLQILTTCGKFCANIDSERFEFNKKCICSHEKVSRIVAALVKVMHLNKNQATITSSFKMRYQIKAAIFDVR
jgi:hypothetical protein